MSSASARQPPGVKEVIEDAVVGDCRYALSFAPAVNICKRVLMPV